jgi:hypothetical protein
VCSEQLQLLRRHAVADHEVTQAIAGLRDTNDAHVVAVAISHHADLIVSSDKDLLTLGTVEGIPVVDIHAFAYTLAFAIRLSGRRSLQVHRHCRPLQLMLDGFQGGLTLEPCRQAGLVQF